MVTMLKNKWIMYKRNKFLSFWYHCYYFTLSETYFIQLETLLISYPSYMCVCVCVCMCIYIYIYIYIILLGWLLECTQAFARQGQEIPGLWLVMFIKKNQFLFSILFPKLLNKEQCKWVICTNTALYFPWRYTGRIKYWYGHGLQFKTAQHIGMEFRDLHVE